jgi:hypothetical protein
MKVYRCGTKRAEQGGGESEEKGMHAILIMCHSAGAPAASDEALARHVEGLQGVPGLVMKTWLRDDETLGGFYLFATREAAEEYLASDLSAGLRRTRHSPRARCGNSRSWKNRVARLAHRSPWVREPAGLPPDA